MKVGDFVYVEDKAVYGYIDEINSEGRIVSVRSFNEKTGKFDLIEVLTMVVKAVGLIKELVVMIGMVFKKKDGNVKKSKKRSKLVES